MSILSDKAIKEQLLKSGFLVDYAESLTEPELQWWRDMCEAAYRETLKMVGEWGEGDCDCAGKILGKRRQCPTCWQALNKLEVSNGH